MDPRKYNGAVLLGLNGIAVKSHGGTDPLDLLMLLVLLMIWRNIILWMI